MTYVMGFVAAVPEGNREAYRKHAESALSLFRRYGTTRMVEAWGDDVPRGKDTDFYRAVDAQPGEVVVFSFQEFADKATADAANEAMMSDPDMETMGASMPFDASRMIYGGFDVLFDKRSDGATGYLDGSVFAVAKDKRDAYRQAYDRLADLIVEQGALRVFDGWEDAVPTGERTDFPRSVHKAEDEAVVFSIIEWPDKATRDAAWESLYADPRMHEVGGLFDEHRRIYGGFTPLLDA